MRQSKRRRPKGEGSITLLPSGNYKMTITIGVGVDGKQKRKSVTAKTKQELLQKVSELRLSVGQPKGKDTQDIYFKTIVDMFLKERKEITSPSTYSFYEWASRTLYVPLHDYKIRDITAIMIDNILDQYQQGHKPSYMNNIKRVLSAVFNWAIDHEYLDVSPMRRTRKRRQTKKKVDITTLPTEEELLSLMEEVKEKAPALYPIFLLGVSTGMRKGEILGLERGDINLKDNTIDINKQRTKEGWNQPLKTSSSYRVIFVSPKVLQTVIEETKGHRRLFEEASYSGYTNRIYKFLKKTTSVPEGFTFHGLRHYHATQLLLKGINVKAVSKRLGHTSIQMTLDLYAHWVPEMDRRASEVVGEQFIVGGGDKTKASA